MNHVEIIQPSRPNQRAAIDQQILAALRECIAWMDAPQRETPLSRAIVADARRVLAAAGGGAR